MSEQSATPLQDRVDRRRNAVRAFFLVFVLDIITVTWLTLSSPVIGTPNVDKGTIERTEDDLSNLNWQQGEEHIDLYYRNAGSSPNGSVKVMIDDWDSAIRIIDASNNQIIATMKPGCSAMKINAVWVDDNTLAIRQMLYSPSPELPCEAGYFLWHWNKLNPLEWLRWVFTAALILMPPLIGAVIGYRLPLRQRKHS